MINSGINLASISGILLLIFCIPSAISAIFSTFFTLQRRVDSSPRVIFLAIHYIWVAILRLFVFPYIGWILISQGFRLDPSLQLAFLVIVFSLICFTYINLWTDYADWRFRQGRAIAVIAESSGYRSLEDIKIKGSRN